jgi:hypothetical protein
MPALIRLQDLPPATPLSQPSGRLHYVDFKYETVAEKRIKKLEELFPDFKDEK